jgi:hypothetical protein
LKCFSLVGNVIVPEHTSVVRLQVLTAASTKFRCVFWDVLPCKMIVDRRFRGAYCVHHLPVSVVRSAATDARASRLCVGSNEMVAVTSST